MKVRYLCLALVVWVSAASAAEPRTPQVQFTQYTLDNGLRVILSEDHSAPVIAINVTYDVGSRNERPGRTGFAHLFEHMMFKGSKNVEPESHTSIIASVGGRSNAYTTEDETVIFAWIVYESREERDRINAAVMEDPRLKADMESGKMPFDVKRMAYGGFKTLVSI